MREFLAADARENVFAAQFGAHHAGQLFQDRVAGQMAEGVVFLLEVVDVEKHEPELAAIAAAAGDLAFERLGEVALVVDLRETIERHHSIDLFVVRGLDVAAVHELEDGAADLDLIAVVQVLFGDERVVDVGAVGRAEVFDLVAAPRPPDARVMTADRLLIDRNTAGRRAAGFDGRLTKRDAAAEILAVDHDEIRFAAERALLGDRELALGDDRAFRCLAVAAVVRLRHVFHRTPRSSPGELLEARLQTGTESRGRAPPRCAFDRPRSGPHQPKSEPM